MNPPGFARCVCIDETCGVVFFAPEHIEQQALRIGEKRWVSCPNGHRYHYLRSEADTLRARVASLESELAHLRIDRDRVSNALVSIGKTASYWKGIAHRGKR